MIRDRTYGLYSEVVGPSPVSTMLLRWMIVIAACFWPDAAKASSFYDNPEQDPLQSQDTAEDLHNKWDFEVGKRIL